MSECLELRFEQLSDWVDGESSPEEARNVEAHLQRCALCRHKVQRLGSLGRVLQKAAPPALNPQFTASVAGRVREQGAGPALWLRRAAVALARSFRGWPGEPGPLSRLISARAARKNVRLPGFGFVLALYALPAFFFGLNDELGDMLKIYLTVVAVALLVLLPVYYFRTEVSILTSLRRGRCLEEMLCAGLCARRMVDTLAWHSAGSILRMGFPVLLVLICSAARLPEKLRGTVLWTSLLWLPGMLLFFWAGSYVVQFLIAWSRNGERPSGAQFGLSVAIFGPALGVAALPCWFGYGPAATLLVLGIAGAWTVGVSRWLAIWGLDHASAVERWNGGRRRRSRTSRSAAPWGDNPIVVRESTPAGGLWRVLTWLVLPAAFYGFLGRSPSESVFWGLLAAIGLGVFLQASARTLSAVVGEKEQRTWETLLQTGLSREEFVRGWIEVAVRPAVGDILPLGLVVVALCATYPEMAAGISQATPWVGLLLGGAALLGLLLLALAGAHTGLALSAASSDYREASAALLRCLAAGGVGLLMGWGVLAGGSTLVAEQGWLDSSSDYWETYLQQVLPLLLVALTCALSLRSARRTLAERLACLGGGVEGERLRAPGAAPGTWDAVRLLVLPGFLAGGLTAALVALAQLVSPYYETWTQVALVLSGCLGGVTVGGALCGLFPAWAARWVGTCRKTWQGSLGTTLLGLAAAGMAWLFVEQALAIVPLFETYNLYPFDYWAYPEPNSGWLLPCLAVSGLLGLAAGLREWFWWRHQPAPSAGAVRASAAWRALALVALGALLYRAAVPPVRDPQLFESLRRPPKAADRPENPTRQSIVGDPMLAKGLFDLRRSAESEELYEYEAYTLQALGKALRRAGPADRDLLAELVALQPPSDLLARSDGWFRRQVAACDRALEEGIPLVRRLALTGLRNRYINWYLEARKEPSLAYPSTRGQGPEREHLTAVWRHQSILCDWNTLRSEAAAQLRRVDGSR